MLKLNNTATLPKELRSVPSMNLLAQAVFVYEDRLHTGLRKTKTRAEINRTGKKVYKQKGTGGARHGSRRANLFVGGGVAHGPRPVRRILNLSKGIKKAALASAISLKFKEKQVLFADGFAKLSKTKEAGDFVKNLKVKKVTFVLSDKNMKSMRFLKNLGGARAVLYKDINAFDVIKGGTLILDSGIFK